MIGEIVARYFLFRYLFCFTHAVEFSVTQCYAITIKTLILPEKEDSYGKAIRRNCCGCR